MCVTAAERWPSQTDTAIQVNRCWSREDAQFRLFRQPRVSQPRIHASDERVRERTHQVAFVAIPESLVYTSEWPSGLTSQIKNAQVISVVRPDMPGEIFFHLSWGNSPCNVWAVQKNIKAKWSVRGFYFYCKIMLIRISYNYCSVLTMIVVGTGKGFHSLTITKNIINVMPVWLFSLYIRSMIINKVCNMSGLYM